MEEAQLYFSMMKTRLRTKSRFKSLLGVALSFWMSQIYSATPAQVFVSFSMPEHLLKEVLRDCARMHVPAMLNGLHENSMPKTVKKIILLAKDVPNLNLQIDPTAFEKFGIHQVPALVISRGKQFDVIYGHLTIREGLERIVRAGDSGFTLDEMKEIAHD